MPLGASISFISLNFSKEHAIFQMRNLIQEGLITFLRPQKAEPEYKPRFFDIQNSYHFKMLKDFSVEHRLWFPVLRIDLH